MKKHRRKTGKKSLGMSSFSTMARRSVEKFEDAAFNEKAFGWFTQMYVEKTMAAQKRRPSVFKRLGRPGIFELCESLFPEKLACALLRVGTQRDLQEQSEFGNRAAALAREHGCFKDFLLLPYASLHDSVISQWIAKPGSLAVLFIGYFSNSGKSGEDYLEARFINPRVRAVSAKGPVKLSAAAKNGAFCLGDNGDGDWVEGEHRSKTAEFAKVSSLGVAFGEMGCVFADERSANSEGAQQEWRIMFGKSGAMEISIGFDALELTVGRTLILEKRKARALACELDEQLPNPNEEYAKKAPRI